MMKKFIQVILFLKKKKWFDCDIFVNLELKENYCNPLEISFLTYAYIWVIWAHVFYIIVYKFICSWKRKKMFFVEEL